MRIATSIAMLIVGALAVWLAAVRAADRSPQNVKPIGALIVRETAISRSGVATTEAIRISDATKLAKLESFFPKYRQRPSSSLAGGWEAGYQVYFDFPQGKSIRVTVSENGDAAYWTLGRGDFDTQGDFNSFVESLLGDG